MDEKLFAERNLAKRILRKLGVEYKGHYDRILNNRKLSLYEKVSWIVESYILENKDKINLTKPLIEGESKKLYRWNNLALIELKPTMYSFTFNRYGIVEGTDNIRLDFWKLFAERINSHISNVLFAEKKSKFADLIKDLYKKRIINEDFPFLSNFLASVSINDKSYAVIRFEESLPPLEVVWKKYLLGTMKHTLKKVDNHKTKFGDIINYEGVFPRDFIRFDWRNPLPDKDECIPEEFADFYVNVNAAKVTGKLVSYLIGEVLEEKGYELADICYFINKEGNIICSEITPDGMRIKKKDQSFDKDLWRAGKDKETIVSVWSKLFLDLNNDQNEIKNSAT